MTCVLSWSSDHGPQTTCVISSVTPSPNSFMSGLKFIAETISLIIPFAALLRRRWHATVAGSNLCASVSLRFSPHMLLLKRKQELCKNVHWCDLATHPGRRLACLIYDTQISADHGSRLMAKVIHTWRGQGQGAFKLLLPSCCRREPGTLESPSDERFSVREREWQESSPQKWVSRGEGR